MDKLRHVHGNPNRVVLGGVGAAKPLGLLPVERLGRDGTACPMDSRRRRYLRERMEGRIRRRISQQLDIHGNFARLFRRLLNFHHSRIPAFSEHSRVGYLGTFILLHAIVDIDAAMYNKESIQR